jgi:hypothetical protein
MSDFEAQCLCYARDARQHEPVDYQWVGIGDRNATLFGIWPECPAHPGEHFVSPVWTQKIGRLDDEAADATAAVEMRD